MLYVLVKRSPLGRSESWRTGEKRGGLRAELFSHTMSGGCSLSNPLLQRNGWLKKKCLVEFIGAVKNCCEVACRWWSESADWSRPALALFCCRALWESVSLLRRLQGPVGWGLSDLWPFSTIPDSLLSTAATNNFQLLRNFTKPRQRFDSILAWTFHECGTLQVLQKKAAMKHVKHKFTFGFKFWKWQLFKYTF